MGSSAPDNVRRLVDHFDRERNECRLAATDRKKTLRFASLAQGDPAGRIDALVSELYGSTEGEIRAAKGRALDERT